MSLSLNDRVHTLTCPNCRKYITSDAKTCRFCEFELDADLLKYGVEKETEEIRKVNFAFHRNFALAGLAFLAVGSVLIAQSLVSDRFFLYSPVLVLLGIGQIIYGCIGMFRERRVKNT